jgi:apolipoprotein N-acyltransferase
MELTALAWVALAPLAIACRRQRPRVGAFLGFLAGLGAGSALYGVLPYGKLLYGVLVIYCAVNMAGFGAGISLLSGRVPRWAEVCLPALLWTGFEYLRRFGTISMPIMISGTQTDLLALAQVCRWVGAHGLSFLVCLPAGVIAQGWALRRVPLRSAIVVASVLATLTALGVGHLSAPSAEGREVRVAGVQSSIPSWVYRVAPASKAHRELIWETLTSMTKQAVAAGDELIVWPETATHEPLPSRPDLVAQVEGLVGAAGATVLAGTVREDSLGRRYNVVAAIAKGRALGIYDKVRPAGYAEWHVTAGEPRGPLETAHGRLGILVCLESVYPEDARRHVAGGAEALIVTTDDAGFLRSPMAEFHVRRAALRAIETGRWVVHLSQAGPSALFDPRGRSVASTGLFEQDLLRGTLRLLSGETLYQRTGDVLPWVVWAMIASLLASSLRARRYRIQ